MHDFQEKLQNVSKTPYWKPLLKTTWYTCIFSWFHGNPNLVQSTAYEMSLMSVEMKTLFLIASRVSSCVSDIWKLFKCDHFCRLIFKKHSAAWILPSFETNTYYIILWAGISSNVSHRFSVGWYLFGSITYVLELHTTFFYIIYTIILHLSGFESTTLQFLNRCYYY